MDLYNIFKNLDKKFSWSFLGFLIGIIGVGYAVYVDHFKIEKLSLIYDVTSMNQVLDIKENLNDLRILYNGEDLKQKQQDLVLMTVNILNNGKRDIRNSDYSSYIPFGIKFENCRIADLPVLLNASNEFLDENVNLSLESDSFIGFNKVQIDQAQNFTIKVITICDSGQVPTILPSGKLSGMPGDIPVIISNSIEKGKISFFKRLNNDVFWIHIIRSIYYLLILIVLIFALLLCLLAVGELIEAKRRKVSKKYRNLTKMTNLSYVNLISELYSENGYSIITRLIDYFKDNRKIIKIVQSIENRKQELNLFHGDELESLDDILEDVGKIKVRSEFENIINNFFNLKILTKSKKKIYIDDRFLSALEEFVTIKNNL